MKTRVSLNTILVTAQGAEISCYILVRFAEDFKQLNHDDDGLFPGNINSKIFF